MNDLERAVIAAAREYVSHTGGDLRNAGLVIAVQRLDQHESTLAAAGLTEVEWSQVAEGDELRGKSGDFYPVTGTKREWHMGKPTGNFVITVRQGALNRALTRGPARGKATVRRGAAGKAVDLFVHVFSSGEAE